MSLDGFLEVKTCSKALLALHRGHGKSPCFLQVAFLHLVGVDCSPLFLHDVDGREIEECAFWHGSK
jgi:hypothetical protein